MTEQESRQHSDYVQSKLEEADANSTPSVPDQRKSAIVILNDTYGNNRLTTDTYYPVSSILEAMQTYRDQEVSAAVEAKDKEIAKMVDHKEELLRSNTRWTNKAKELDHNLSAANQKIAADQQQREMDTTILNHHLSEANQTIAELRTEIVELDMHYRYIVECYNRVKPDDDKTTKELWDDYCKKTNQFNKTK